MHLFWFRKNSKAETFNIVTVFLSLFLLNKLMFYVSLIKYKCTILGHRFIS